MIRRTFAVALFLGLAFAIAAAARSVDAGGAPPANEWKLTIDDNGKAISIEHGVTLIVILPATPGTGYGWATTRDAGKHLKQLGKADFMPEADPMPGTPGKEVFQFAAISAGSGILELHYVRPWEKNVAPARVFKVTIAVK